ncbi:serine/threonine-protein phosphatase 6 regulatory ankyrin repeat subunit A-like [Ruditapes philippinarum]|uniref:serine/threonine-protein phosphatase 6 regulatory ankyrin repeat subunit A-like n=1 Tax=Ruditapes philippinarum TaxID=129788 RepID=UPI00295B3CF7|nr:serine/threonine-protein phosphatase 6 regulatory ankyrin repeat subunit A-like [Ruditapes philippinarum]
MILADLQGHLALVELLVQNKADLSLADESQNTALHYACMNDHEDLALLILDKIDDQNVINKANQDMKTALHIAAKQGLTPVVQDLIAKGASLTAVDNKGYSPALSCAPNDRVADCLAIILAHMSFAPSMSSTFIRSRNENTSGFDCLVLMDQVFQKKSLGSKKTGECQHAD